jgi:hypothetical protein
LSLEHFTFLDPLPIVTFKEDVEANYLPQLTFIPSHGRKRGIDRFDRVLVFNRLSYEVQIEVGRLHLQWEIEAQEHRGHKITECDAEALKAIVRNGYSEKQGATNAQRGARSCAGSYP